MSLFKRIKSLTILIVAPFILLADHGSARAQGFAAPLVPCNSVAVPAALSCPGTSDPLKNGFASINAMGDVTVVVTGAATNTSYTATFVANDSSSSTTLGSLMTGPKGNGYLRALAFFKFGTVGAGNIVIDNGANEEFVTGFTVSTSGFPTAADFQPGLVRCADVVVPDALAACGSDPLTNGSAEIEQSDWALRIRVHGATPGESYTAVLQPPSGSALPLGTVGPTNSHGDAKLDVANKFPAETIGSGQIILQRSGANQFVSGFKVNQKFVPPPVAASNLVPCGQVTDPTLSSCGSDPLDVGLYEVNRQGQLTVKLVGAAPSTNYEVFFRPLDNSGDTDTTVAVPTNALGNATVAGKKVFSSGTVAAGSFVLKEQSDETHDQFVAGFNIH